jgi:hypothetical protein
LQTFFNTAPLVWYDLLLCIGLGALVLVGIEFEKWVSRRGETKSTAAHSAASEM